MVGFGGFIGGSFRYLLTRLIQTHLTIVFPLGTFAVNMTGCFLLGIVFGLSIRHQLAPELQQFLAIGVLGGFTTYSAFSMESVALIRNGHFSVAAAYILTSVLIGLLLTFVGIKISD